MSADLAALSLSALSIGFFHTLYGPDHYVPFVAMSQVGRWSLKKTVCVTLICGCGHVGSSVLLGFVGIAFGLVVLQLELIESLRGDLAGWLLIGFGALYFLYGLYCAITRRPVPHTHIRPDGAVIGHAHDGSSRHERMTAAGDDEPAGEGAAQQPSGEAVKVSRMTPWLLVTIFVFGPCEPLIPLLMYPAAKADPWSVAWVTLLFALATLVTMTTLVVLMYLGAGNLHFQRLSRYSHAIAGLVVLACGLAVKLGL